MTELYKKNGAVFIPAGITVEEVEKPKGEVDDISDYWCKGEIQLTKAKELIQELSFSLYLLGECGVEERELLNRAEQFLKDSIE